MQNIALACCHRNALADGGNGFLHVICKSIPSFLLKTMLFLFTLQMCIAGPLSSGALTFSGAVELVPNFTLLAASIALVDMLMTASTENWHTLELSHAAMQLIDFCFFAEIRSTQKVETIIDKYFDTEDDEGKEERMRKEVEADLKKFTAMTDRICFFNNYQKITPVGSINDEEDDEESRLVRTRQRRYGASS